MYSSRGQVSAARVPGRPSNASPSESRRGRRASNGGGVVELDARRAARTQRGRCELEGPRLCHTTRLIHHADTHRLHRMNPTLPQGHSPEPSATHEDRQTGRQDCTTHEAGLHTTTQLHTEAPMNRTAAPRSPTARHRPSLAALNACSDQHASKAGVYSSRDQVSTARVPGRPSNASPGEFTRHATGHGLGEVAAVRKSDART